MVKAKLSTGYFGGNLSYVLKAKIHSLTELKEYLDRDLGLPKRAYIIHPLMEDPAVQALLQEHNFFPAYNLWRFKVEDIPYQPSKRSRFSLTSFDHELDTETWGNSPSFWDYQHLNDALIAECVQRESRDYSSTGTDPSFIFLGERIFLLYNEEGEAVGYSCTEVDDNTLYVWTTYLDPSVRSTRAFSYLISALATYAKSKGCLFIEASTDPTPINPLNKMFSRRGGVHITTTYSQH